MTALGSAFFLFWGVICLLAPRHEARSALFRFLNGRNNATMVGSIFMGISVWLFGEWVW